MNWTDDVQPSDSLHPAVSSGDFDKVVELKGQKDLSDREKFYL